LFIYPLVGKGCGFGTKGGCGPGLPGQATQKKNYPALTNLRECQAHIKLKFIRDADDKERAAEKAFSEAYAAVEKYEKTCAEVKQGNKALQNTYVLGDIATQGAEATRKNLLARSMGNEVIKLFEIGIPALRILDPNGRCAQQMEEDKVAIQKEFNTLDSRAKSLAQCNASGNSEPSEVTERETKCSGLRNTKMGAGHSGECAYQNCLAGRDILAKCN